MWAESAIFLDAKRDTMLMSTENPSMTHIPIHMLPSKAPATSPITTRSPVMNANIMIVLSCHCISITSRSNHVYIND